jgi:hypothetical protein
MIKYTISENRTLTQMLSATAKVAGLLGADERLQYETGNVRFGHATVIRKQKLDEDGNWRNEMRPTWVPEFGYKDGPSVVGNTLFAVLNAIEPFANKAAAE